MTMRLAFSSGDTAQVPDVAAAIDCCVAVYHLKPLAGAWQTEPVMVPDDWSKVQDDGDFAAGFSGLANERKDAAIGVRTIEPVETVEFVVRLPEGRILQI